MTLDDRGLPVIIPTLNRLALLDQTLTSLFENSSHPIYPIIIDGGSTPAVRANIKELSDQHLIRYYPMKHKTGVGVCRNFGAAIAPIHHPYLYFSDDDIYFKPHWDTAMLKAYEQHPKLGILGGLRHPFHGRLETLACSNQNHEVVVSDQQAGFSMLIRREIWSKVGPFPITSPTDYGIEDTDLCNRTRSTGYLVGGLNPPVLVHCGITRADGTLTAGHDLIAQEKLKYPNLYFA